MCSNLPHYDVTVDHQRKFCLTALKDEALLSLVSPKQRCINWITPKTRGLTFFFFFLLSQIVRILLCQGFLKNENSDVFTLFFFFLNWVTLVGARGLLLTLSSRVIPGEV